MSFDKTDPRYTGEKGWLSIKGYLQELEIDMHTEQWTLVLDSERNIGKSTAVWNLIEQEIWEKYNYTKRIVYARTNLTKMKKARSDFNGKYYYGEKKYWMSEDKIYKCVFDEHGREDKDNRIEIGTVIGIENAENYKSMRFDNYMLMFWDEYNQETNGIGLWGKLVDVMKTIKRNNPVFGFLFVGNKVNPNNDVLVHLEVEPYLEDDGEDQLIVASENPKIYFVSVSKATFAHLNQEDDVVNVFASFDEQTDIYLNKGGYLMAPARDVLVWRKRIQPTAKPLMYLVHGLMTVEYGEFILNGKQVWYMHQVNEPDFNYRVIALDQAGNLQGKNIRTLWDADDYKRLADKMKIRLKWGELFFSNYDVKRVMENWIIAWTTFTKD